MVTLAAGAVVLVPFPFSDLSRSKLRPTVVLAEVGRGDWILCQVTSNPYSDAQAVRLSEDDFRTGSLQVESYARPVLQEKGVEELTPRHRAKTRAIYHSAEPVKRQPPAERYFDVCIIGHLRDEKDPFRAALAARLLLLTSRIRVIHTGRPYDEEFAERARLEASENPRYRWLGEVPR